MEGAGWGLAPELLSEARDSDSLGESTVAPTSWNSVQPFGAHTHPVLWDLVESLWHPLWNCE